MIGTIKTIIGAPKVKKAEALYPNPNKEIFFWWSFGFLHN